MPRKGKCLNVGGQIRPPAVSKSELTRLCETAYLVLDTERQQIAELQDKIVRTQQRFEELAQRTQELNRNATNRERANRREAEGKDRLILDEGPKQELEPRYKFAATYPSSRTEAANARLANEEE